MMAAALMSIAARAHEANPAEMVWDAGQAVLTLRVNAEAALAGIDLSVHPDTDDAPEAAAYDALRALDAGTLEARVADEVAVFTGGITGEGLEGASLISIRVEDAPAALPRDTVIVLAVEAPHAVSLGMKRGFGEVIVTEAAADGFGALLAPGEVTPALAGTGTEGPVAAFAGAVVSGLLGIVPRGLDHLAFVLGIFFYALAPRPLLWQMAAFASGCAVTVALTAAGMIPSPASWIGPLIGLSIVWVGLANAFPRRGAGEIGWGRIATILGFGLVHGMALADTVRGRSGAVDLLGFAVGTAVALFAAIGLALFLLALPLRRGTTLQGRYAAIRGPASLAIAAIGVWWAAARTLPG